MEGALSAGWGRGAPGRIDQVWIAPERVVIGAGGHLQGIERSSGRLVWEARRRAGIESGTLLDSRLVFVDETGATAAYQIDDGKPQWSDPAASKKDKGAGPASFAPVPGGEAIIAVEGSRICRRSLGDGKIVWSRDLPRAVRSGAVIEDEKVIFPAGRSVAAYRLDSGEPLWGEDLGGVSYLVRLAEGAGAAIAVTERDLVIRIDTGSGRRAWQMGQSVALGTDLPPSGGGDPGALFYLESTGLLADEAAGAAGAARLVLDSERVYVAGSDFSVRAFDLATGALRWSLPLRGSASLHRAGAFLCIQGASPGLQCLDPESGKKIWEHADDVEIVRPLAGGLLALGAGRDIKLLDGRDGRPLGRARLEQRPVSLHASPEGGLLIAVTRRGLTALRVGKG
jgi:outer membrane protein assembly factor BamB